MDFSKIKAFAFDVDGVLTDGGITCDLSGELYRCYDSKDSFGIRIATMRSYPVAIITGGRSKAICSRAGQLGILQEDVYLGSRDKIEDFDDFCQRKGLKAEEVAYVGDDLPDIAVILKCGLGVCPSDAVSEVRGAADMISEFPGGKGCVRNLIELVLKNNGDWNFDVNQYKSTF